MTSRLWPSTRDEGRRRCAGTKIYSGTRTKTSPLVVVTETTGHGVGRRSQPLDPRLDLCSHSPDLEWGGGGHPSAQLALAILADHLEDAARAVQLHQRFKLAVVARLPYRGWTLSADDVAAAIRRL